MNMYVHLHSAQSDKYNWIWQQIIDLICKVHIEDRCQYVQLTTIVRLVSDVLQISLLYWLSCTHLLYCQHLQSILKIVSPKRNRLFPLAFVYKTPLIWPADTAFRVEAAPHQTCAMRLQIMLNLYHFHKLKCSVV